MNEQGDLLATVREVDAFRRRRLPGERHPGPLLSRWPDRPAMKPPPQMGRHRRGVARRIGAEKVHRKPADARVVVVGRQVLSQDSQIRTKVRARSPPPRAPKASDSVDLPRVERNLSRQACSQASRPLQNCARPVGDIDAVARRGRTNGNRGGGWTATTDFGRSRLEEQAWLHPRRRVQGRGAERREPVPARSSSSSTSHRARRWYRRAPSAARSAARPSSPFFPHRAV